MGLQGPATSLRAPTSADSSETWPRPVTQPNSQGKADVSCALSVCPARLVPSGPALWPQVQFQASALADAPACCPYPVAGQRPDLTPAAAAQPR